MSSSRRSLLYLVSIAALVASMAQTIYTPTLVSVRHEFATTNVMIGTTMAVYSLVLAIGQLIYGPLVDLFSGRRILIGALWAFIGSSILAYFAPTIELFIVTRGLQAAGIGAATVVGAAIIADLFPAEERGRAMGRFQAFNAAGGSVGFVVGSTIILIGSWRYNFLLLAAAALVVVVGARQLMPSQNLQTPQFSVQEAKRILLTPPALAIAMVGLLQMSANFTYHTFLPSLFHDKTNVPESLVGYLLIFNSLSIMFGATIGGRYADRVDRRLLTIVGVGLTFLATIGVTGGAAATTSFFTLPIVIAFQIVFYLALGASIPVQLALILEWFPAIRGTAVGAYTAMRFLGASIGPVIAGAAVDSTSALWTAFGVATVTLAIACLVAVSLVAEPKAARASQRLT